MSLNIFMDVVSSKPLGGDDVVGSCTLADGSMLLVLADGATGYGFGRRAAERFVDFCVSEQEYLTRFDEATEENIANIFNDCDFDISTGLTVECDTTGVLLVLKGRNYVCASIGDSLAWDIPTVGPAIELTKGQRRKPRIGSGCFFPMINRGTLQGALLMASDGLEYAIPLEKAMSLVRQGEGDLAAHITRHALAVNDQKLPDDLGVIVAVPR